ncbi:MLO-like protein 1 [Trifolium pratense]|uniref:MLO-like protein 1 n=1 Tax=Trifolium pratense TaxID=57577 RepID=UPI001E69070F|nr:MLO-like protein 1 [Trifolium pratense]
MSAGTFEEGPDLKFTPTWIVALVCTVFIFISYGIVRSLHYFGKFLLKKEQKPLYQALQKIKQEFMLVGFMSLFLTVTQNGITKICIPKSWFRYMLPCKLEEKEEERSKPPPTSHFQTFFSSDDVFDNARLLLDIDTDGRLPFLEEIPGYCAAKGKVPLLSVEALHHLHIFIFVQAVTHVALCILTVGFVGLIIRRWERWEDAITNEDNESRARTLANVHHHEFIKDRGKYSSFMGWVKSFFKQFYGSVTKLDYVALRHGFIMTHCRGHPRFNFHKYVNRALEDDFKRIVGINWYLWFFVVLFLLLNITGWHTYFWISFIPFLLLFAVGTKLEHVIIQLANEVSDKKSNTQCGLIVQPSDDHFWFHRPRIVLYLIHLILFQNSFEIAYFLWILFTYGPDACIMGQFAYIVLRLIIGAFIQILCSFSILPLYAIVTQMGTHFKNVIFNEQIQEKLIGWAQKAKRRAHENHGQSSVEGSPHHGASESTGDESPECTNSSSSASVSIELASVSRREPALEEEEEEDEIVPSNEEIV